MAAITLSTAALYAGAAVAAGAAIKSMKPGDPAKDTSAAEIARERARAEAEAANASNSKLAAKNRARKASSLLARDGAPIMLGQGAGKSTLGQ
jgi:hypothetical protein